MTSTWRSTTCLLTCSVQMLVLENDWLHLPLSLISSLGSSQKYSQDKITPDRARFPLPVQSRELHQIQNFPFFVFFQTREGSPPSPPSMIHPGKNAVRRINADPCSLFQVKPLIRMPVWWGKGTAPMYGCIVWSWQKPNNPTSSGNTTCHCVRGATKGLASDRNAFCASQAA